ncbi:rhamnogalacturonyl hydrolase YesR [Lewinella aquimaris]|uniref:Rhamnogalacturonyl hydrolase YesR n=1 Tax=Neolewinella aquimaris TaxID=1835722 RepID=A0A840EBU5_9BACT|nr:glycoside hydrolase family 88 protein [Neolewinella aquimaris]MBB4080985.1 rhamnogalacturonyl hydrolase YesR [Neolewinella aquimaris]
MRTATIQYFLLLLLPVLLSACRTTAELPPPERTLDQLRRANAYFMEKWPDTGKRIVTNKSRASNIWTRAVYYEGLMALHRIDPQPEYYKYATDWADFHEWDLRDGETYTRNADNQAAGQTYIELYQIDPQPERITAIKASVDSMLRTDQVDDWNWIDAIQMGMPIFAQLGVMYDEPAYFERMYEMYRFTKEEHGDNGLYNPEDHLWWRDADFDPPYTEPNGEDSYWSRGNGWVIMALARVLEILPESDPHREEYIKDFRDMMAAIAKVQREDGFWNVSLHDPTHFGGKETSGTAMFVYGMAWGINHNLLDRSTYLPALTKGWNAMVNDALHDNGFLGYVQSTGKEPKDGQPLSYDKIPDFEDYGLGAFLLAGTEIYTLELRSR